MIGGRAATNAVVPGRCIISIGDPESPLPSGWSWVPLSSVADLGTGHTPSRKNSEYWDGDIPWIGVRDAGRHHGGIIMDTAQHVTDLGLANSSARLLPKDTVCLSRTASVGYVVVMGRPMATSQDFVTWSCSECLDPQFLVRALLAEGDDIRKFGEGSTHTTIYFPEVKAFHIALPPLSEQRRIVAKIDGLSAKSKHAREHLHRVPRLVRKYKQAILAAAFSGELTREWRLTHGAPKWHQVAVEDVASTIFDGPFGSNLKSSDYTSSGVRVVRLENLGHLRFIREKESYISSKKYKSLRRHTLEPSDVLFSSFVSDEVRVCLLPEDLPTLAVNKADCFCIRTNHEVCRPKFLMLRLASRQTYEEFEQAVHGATRPRISLTQLRAFEFELPSLTEQDELIGRIEAAFSWVDRLVTETTSASKLIKHLDQAVLAKAFRGELERQDSTDEPASVLLERIRAERVSGDPRMGSGAKLRRVKASSRR